MDLMGIGDPFAVLRHQKTAGWNRLPGNRGAELDALRAAQRPVARQLAGT